jgi:hypothetical protein
MDEWAKQKSPIVTVHRIKFKIGTKDRSQNMKKKNASKAGYS